HRWLQRIADDELRGWDARRIEGLRQRFTGELRRRGVPDREQKASAELVVVALKNAVSDERGRWVLGPHPEARSEYRIRTRLRKGTGTYVIDRIFRTVAGVSWVVDYKTSRHEGSDPQPFLDRERERYAEQLQAYMVALRVPRGGLFFPLLGGWREVS